MHKDLKDIIEVNFAGATGIVTGSQFVMRYLDNNDMQKNISIDLGAVPRVERDKLEDDNFDEETKRKERTLEQKIAGVFPLAPVMDGVIFTHAHFDHIGKARTFCERYGFGGPYFTTPDTKKLGTINLQSDNEDLENVEIYREILKNIHSKKIGEIESEYINLKPTFPDLYDEFLDVNDEERIKKIINWANHIDPAEIKSFKDLFFSLDYYKEHNLDDKFSFEFYDASHILGSAQVLTRHKNSDGSSTNILFSGDIGYRNQFFDGPDYLEGVDHLVMECTNGNRYIDTSQEALQETREQIKNIINDTYKKGGQTIFSVFAINRMQEIMNHVQVLYENGEIPSEEDVDYIYNSPAGCQTLYTYRDCLKEDEHRDIRRLNCDILIDEDMPFKRINKSSRQSWKSINSKDPAVVLAASGMISDDRYDEDTKLMENTTKGRIKHYIAKENGLDNPANSYVICGYQAENLGQKLVQSITDDSIDKVNIDGKEIALKAQIHKLNNISGHAGVDELVDYAVNANPKTITLVHGDHEIREKFIPILQKELQKSGCRTKAIYAPSLHDRIAYTKDDAYLRKISCE